MMPPSSPAYLTAAMAAVTDIGDMLRFNIAASSDMARAGNGNAACS